MTVTRPPVCSIGNIARNPIPVTPCIEGTILDHKATEEQIRDLCDAAVFYGWKGVCVYPENVGQVSRLLRGSKVIPVSVVGFPDGTVGTEQKVADVRKAVANGAKEVDMVINVKDLKAGEDRAVKTDIQGVADVAHLYGVNLKVILEAGTLTDEEISRGSRLALEAGADFLKRSTGFEPEENKIKDDSVRNHQLDLMADAIGEYEWKRQSAIISPPPPQIKDSGQIRTLSTARGSVQHGATRLGIGFESAIKISEDETGNRWPAARFNTRQAA